MKTTPSTSVVTGRNFGRGARRLLLIGQWEEEAFNLPVQGVAGAAGGPGEEWEQIEAIGAADDASRFRINEPLDDLAEVQP